MCTPADIAPGFEARARAKAEGWLIVDSPFSGLHGRPIMHAANMARLPVAYAGHHLLADGVLIAYAPNPQDLFARAATYVARILGGAQPGDPPIEQPTKFDLVINLKAAQALGVQVPQGLLSGADEVIR